MEKMINPYFKTVFSLQFPFKPLITKGVWTKMERQTKRKTMILVLSALVLVGIPMTISGLERFWQRDFDPVVFSYHYENFLGFVSNSWTSYQAQAEVLILEDGMTLVTITENTYLSPLALDCVFTTNCTGAELTATARYVELYRSDGNQIINGGSAFFDIPTDGTPVSLDPSLMEWADCQEIGVIGHALEITYSIDTSEATATESGDYTYSVSVGIGAE